MAYGIAVWDQQGQLGNASSDNLAMCIFADVIPWAPFPYVSVVVHDVETQPGWIYWYSGGRWINYGFGDAAYDGVAKTLTLRNSTGADRFFLALSW